MYCTRTGRGKELPPLFSHSCLFGKLSELPESAFTSNYLPQTHKHLDAIGYINQLTDTHSISLLNECSSLLSTLLALSFYFHTLRFLFWVRAPLQSLRAILKRVHPRLNASSPPFFCCVTHFFLQLILHLNMCLRYVLYVPICYHLLTAYC